MSEYKPEQLENIGNSDFLPAYASHNTDAIRAMLRAGAQAMRDLEKAQERVKELEETIQVQLMLVHKQAKDDGLWFIARTAPEAYLQQELRKLHGAIEVNAAALQVKP